MNGTLNNNLNVSNCNSDVNSLCEHCLVVEDTEHLLYKCTLVENIGRKISFFFGFEITFLSNMISYNNVAFSNFIPDVNWRGIQFHRISAMVQNYFFHSAYFGLKRSFLHLNSFRLDDLLIQMEQTNRI